MKKFLLGFVAAAAVAAPIALTAGSANAANAEAPAGSTCTPSAAATDVTHTEYQWAALVAKGGLHWDYKWTATTKNPSSDMFHVWVKSLDLKKPGRPQITRTVVDTPAKAAVTCSITLPEHFEGEGTYRVVVPFVKGVDTFLKGVQGYDEKVAITQDVTVTKDMAGQFWIDHAAQEGYVIANLDTAQWHIDFQFAYDGSTAVNAQGVGTVGAGTVEAMNTANLKFVGGYVNSTDNAWTCSDGTIGSAVRTVTSTRPIAATPKTDWHGNVLGWSLNGFSTTDAGTVVGTGPRFATLECPAGSSFTGLLTPAITHVNYVRVSDGTSMLDLPVSAA